ncbi:MAG TPA: hypothetical protein VMV87_21025 [Burkholderiales bacterium]|nr:hypothetical protein [Burkholderiales bacterium]
MTRIMSENSAGRHPACAPASKAGFDPQNAILDRSTDYAPQALDLIEVELSPSGEKIFTRLEAGIVYNQTLRVRFRPI